MTLLYTCDNIQGVLRYMSYIYRSTPTVVTMSMENGMPWTEIDLENQSTPTNNKLSCNSIHLMSGPEGNSSSRETSRLEGRQN